MTSSDLGFNVYTCANKQPLKLNFSRKLSVICDVKGPPVSRTKSKAFAVDFDCVHCCLTCWSHSGQDFVAILTFFVLFVDIVAFLERHSDSSAV